MLLTLTEEDFFLLALDTIGFLARLKATQYLDLLLLATEKFCVLCFTALSQLVLVLVVHLEQHNGLLRHVAAVDIFSTVVVVLNDRPGLVQMLDVLV
jgi:hypothetical protein